MGTRRRYAVVLTFRLPYLAGAQVNRLFREWAADWKVSGKAESTVKEYQRTIIPLLADLAGTSQVAAGNRSDLPDYLDLPTVKRWVAEGRTPSIRRDRAKAMRAFLRWCHTEEVGDFSWWSRIPTVTIPEAPQETVTEDVYRAVLAKARSHRDKALVATLWASGLRRSELARLQVADLDLENACVVVSRSKTGRPRIAPLSPEAVKALYRYLRTRGNLTSSREVNRCSSAPISGPLWLGERGPLTSDGIRLVLQRLGAPSAHAWRRGWAVDSLRNGISQVSVQHAAGWNSGAMVTRYTRALGQELAADEFARRWAS